jgi:hypothetical protein
MTEQAANGLAINGFRRAIVKTLADRAFMSETATSHAVPPLSARYRLQ